MIFLFSPTFFYDPLEKPGCFTIKILTPADPEQRGAQLSLQIIGIEGIKIFEELQQMGVCVMFSERNA